MTEIKIAQTTIQIDKQLLINTKKYALDHDCCMRDVIERALRAYLATKDMKKGVFKEEGHNEKI